MYNDYQLLSSEDKETILERFKCEKMSFKDNWVVECIGMFKESVNTLKLSNKSSFYMIMRNICIEQLTMIQP